MISAGHTRLQHFPLERPTQLKHHLISSSLSLNRLLRRSFLMLPSLIFQQEQTPTRPHHRRRHHCLPLHFSVTLSQRSDRNRKRPAYLLPSNFRHLPLRTLLLRTRCLPVLQMRRSPCPLRAILELPQNYRRRIRCRRMQLTRLTIAIPLLPRRTTQLLQLVPQVIPLPPPI